MDGTVSGTGGSGSGGDGGGSGGIDGTGGGSGSGGATGSGGALTCTVSTTPTSGAVNIDLGTLYQKIRGFGGASLPGWIADLTPEQVDMAFGNGAGQLGLSILRIRVPYDSTKFSAEVPTAARAISLGAIVMASPWTPPANLKTNNDIVGGELATASYAAYADHLLSFRDYMAAQNAPLYAISVQNEPDISVTYESMDWTASQLLSWVKAQGSKFGSTKLIASESFHFDHAFTDPILNDSTAAPLVSIIGGHIYGAGLADYPLARNKGKEVWMTEHFTESSNSGNAWPLALDVAKEIHNCMAANFSAYIWWYIRRSYGLILEDGTVSKRGSLVAQYAKFARPDSVRVGATSPSTNVLVTAYKNGGQVVVVAVNTSTSAQSITLHIQNGCVDSFAKYTTSGTKNVSSDGTVTVTSHSASVTLDAQSTTTFVSQ